MVGEGDIGKETPDVSVRSVRNSPLSLISTIDFFYPLVEDPYAQGRISLCNVVSDLYAMGIEHIDNVLMVLGVSRDMQEADRDIVTSQMIKGFNDAAIEAKAIVTGGQTIYNPWPMIGGVGISVSSKSEFVMPTGSQSGDVLVLSKALGTQIAGNLNQWHTQQDKKWEKASSVISKEEALEAFARAEQSMGTLNLTAAKAIRKYGVKAATDVTGFGILGHAQYLCEVQKERVDFVIDTLPVFKNLFKVEKVVRDFGLMKGVSAETSGGVLACVPKEQADAYVRELREQGQIANIVGEVREGENKASIVDNAKILEV